MERKETIRGAYRMTGENNFYDGMITCSTLSGKAVCRLVWAMNKAENDAYLEKALSGIPEYFSGKLLEVPVGTGILTMPVYQTMPEADITCLDYSPDMMRQAREKADYGGRSNCLPRFLNNQRLSSFLDTHLLQEHVHNDEYHNREQVFSLKWITYCKVKSKITAKAWSDNRISLFTCFHRIYGLHATVKT